MAAGAWKSTSRSTIQALSRRLGPQSSDSGASIQWGAAGLCMNIAALKTTLLTSTSTSNQSRRMTRPISDCRVWPPLECRFMAKTCSTPFRKRSLTPIAGLLCVAALSSPALAAEITPIPNLTGTWGRGGLFHFEPPASGAGPVTNSSNFDDRVVRVGDYTNPILTPQSAQIVKQRG